MNKRLAAGLLALLLVLAAGCGKYADENNGGKAASNSGTSTSTNSGNNTSNSSINTGTNTSNSSSTTNTSNNTNTTKASTKPTFEKVNLGPLQKGQEAKVGPLTIKVEDFNLVDKGAGLPPGGTFVFLLMKVTVTNAGPDPYTVNVGDNFKMDAPDGKRANWNVQASATRTPRLEGTIDKGETKTGWLGYLVKKQPGTFKYTFTHMDWGDAYWTFTIQ
jgi:hypothetical protein